MTIKKFCSSTVISDLWGEYCFNTTVKIASNEKEVNEEELYKKFRNNL